MLEPWIQYPAQLQSHQRARAAVEQIPGQSPDTADQHLHRREPLKARLPVCTKEPHFVYNALVFYPTIMSETVNENVLSLEMKLHLPKITCSRQLPFIAVLLI